MTKSKIVEFYGTKRMKFISTLTIVYVTYGYYEKISDESFKALLTDPRIQLY
jgi:hypothetical protein